MTTLRGAHGGLGDVHAALENGDLELRVLERGLGLCDRGAQVLLAEGAEELSGLHAVAHVDVQALEPA